MNMEVSAVCWESPLGWISVGASDVAIVRLSFGEERPSEAPLFSDHPLLTLAMKQVHAWFDGRLTHFDLPLVPEGTPFQRRVWDELLRIPYGVTISYLELARRLGDEKCIRAAAAANGRNPVGLIIPCHRVIGNTGKLVGYAGGLWRKQWLLQHETQHSPIPEGRLF